MFLGVGIGDGLGRFCEGWSNELVQNTYGRIDRTSSPKDGPLAERLAFAQTTGK